MRQRPQGAFKIILVPVENIRTHSPAGTLPEYVTVSQDVLYEVIGEITADQQFRVDVPGYGHMGVSG